MDSGVGSASEERELVEIESARLRTLHLSHLRVVLHSSAEERQAGLAHALREIKSLTEEPEKRFLSTTKWRASCPHWPVGWRGCLASDIVVHVNHNSVTEIGCGWRQSIGADRARLSRRTALSILLHSMAGDRRS